MGGTGFWTRRTRIIELFWALKRKSFGQLIQLSMSSFKEIQWVIQRNLSSEDTIEALANSCNESGVDYVLFDMIPFSTNLPDFPKEKKSIFYGSTTTMYLAYRDEHLKEGVFFDEKEFSIKNYVDKWGEHMLNSGAHFLPIKDVSTLDYSSEKWLFVRPNEDSKSFSGAVMKYAEIATWLEGVQQTETFVLTPETEIVIAEPFHIESEWRLWVVAGRVVAATKYRQDFRLQKESGCPSEVLNFAEARCKEYTPHEIFVMDIGLCGGQYYIIECGCMNSAGFYSADIRSIVQTVSNHFRNRFSA